MSYRITIYVLTILILSSCSSNDPYSQEATPAGKKCLEEADRQAKLREAGKPSRYVFCDHIKGEI